MPPSAKYFSLILAFIISLLSFIAIRVNSFIYKFPGNNYFPPGITVMGAILFISLMGVYLVFDKDSPFFKVIREFIYFFLVITVIAYATNAVQLTPFSPIDRQLIAIDSIFYINLQKIIAWTESIPWLKKILGLSYDSLPYQMCYLPLIIIAARKFNAIREYYALLLLTTLIGFSFYYFFPTMGPSSFIQSPYFIKEQYATGLKFRELHQHLHPSTLDGGLIAMPSFHAIWAWLCLHLIRCWPIVYAVLLPINILLVISCVLLGWHYCIDLVGSLIVIVAAHRIYFYYVKQYVNSVGNVKILANDQI